MKNKIINDKRLILIDENKEYFEIDNLEKFEEEISIEELKGCYQGQFNYITYYEICEDLFEQKYLSDMIYNDNIEDLKYTLDYLEKLLMKKIGGKKLLEFKDFCEEEFDKNLGIKKKQILGSEIK